MTRDTDATTNPELAPIGFRPSYLPNSSIKNDLPSKNNDPLPYPSNVSSGGTFPVPYSLNIPSSRNISGLNNSSDSKLAEKVPPPYLSDGFSPTLSVIHLNNGKGSTNFDKEEIKDALSRMEIKASSESAEDEREFFEKQDEVMKKVKSANSNLSKEERDNFIGEMRRIDQIRIEHLKKGEKHKDEENEEKFTNDEEIAPCSFDITSLLLKFPQLVIDSVMCIKSGIAGLTTFPGAIFFTISSTAALFTVYFLTLYCLCRRTKGTRISEFLHSVICTAVFLIASSNSADEHLRAFGFLASVPYGSEVCWKSWNFLKDPKKLLSS